MTTPQGSPKSARSLDGDPEYSDSHNNSSQKHLSCSSEDVTETGILRARIKEQSSLICILKQRADELVLRFQALQKVNAELEAQVTDSKKKVEDERKKAKMLEKRLLVVVANHQAIIGFMDEYKCQNAQLRLQNKQLQRENDTVFSQKLQDKEVALQKLMQEVKLFSNKEDEYREKISGCQINLLKQASEYQAKETLLCDQLHQLQQRHTDAAQMCKDVKLQLQTAEEQNALRELHMRESITSLTKEKESLLCLSLERGKVIQEKQEEIQQLMNKIQAERKARAKVEGRFKEEAEAVNRDARVTSLQASLDEATRKYEKLNKDFEAYREHSSSLLAQERELNKKLRHMIG